MRSTAQPERRGRRPDFFRLGSSPSAQFPHLSSFWNTPWLTNTRATTLKSPSLRCTSPSFSCLVFCVPTYVPIASFSAVSAQIYDGAFFPILLRSSTVANGFVFRRFLQVADKTAFVDANDEKRRSYTFKQVYGIIRKVFSHLLDLSLPFSGSCFSLALFLACSSLTVVCM